MSNNNKLLLHLSTTSEISNKFCGICSLEIKTTTDYIGCNECFTWFHIKCKIKNPKQVQKLNRCSEWFCDPLCEDNNRKSNQTSSDAIAIPENPTIKDLFMVLVKHINQSEEDKLKLEQSLADQKIITDREINHLKHQVNSLKQQQIQNNVIITGVPYNQEEDLQSIFTNITNTIKSEIIPKTVDLKRIFFNNTASNKKSSVIKATFARNSDKKTFFKELRANGPLFLKQIVTQPTTQHDAGLEVIYFRTELIPYYNKLLYDCRQYKKVNQYKHTWYSDGKICLRQTDDSKIYRFRSFDEFKNFQNLMQTSSEIQID
jgi:hypothetical protein